MCLGPRQRAAIVPRPSITKAQPYTFKRGVFAGRTFYSEYGYRAALVQLYGPPHSYSVRSAEDYAALRPASRVAHERALDALARMRRQGMSLTDAARAAGTTRQNVTRHVGTAIKRDTRERYIATRSDLFYRRMIMETDSGSRIVEPATSRAASLIGKHYAAMRHFLVTGDSSRIDQFRGAYITTRDGEQHNFLTNLDEIERLGRAGEFSFESLYEHAA